MKLRAGLHVVSKATYDVGTVATPTAPPSPMKTSTGQHCGLETAEGSGCLRVKGDPGLAAGDEYGCRGIPRRNLGKCSVDG
jgi:hypothetical protein